VIVPDRDSILTLERPPAKGPPLLPPDGLRPNGLRPTVPRTRPDERPARQSLREQITRLESELQALFCTTYRRSFSDRTYLEEKHRRRIEEMLLEPGKHRWVRIGNEDIGEPGCKHWHVRPKWGLLGMLMNWWRVRISSGCPLARGRGLGRDPALARAS
jgi:hypothetical protein